MDKFLIGLGVGLFGALVVFIVEFSKKKNLEIKNREEISKLKSMLTERMDLESEGLSKLKKEIETLKKQNENLRITNANLMQKPQKGDMQRLAVYQKAVDRLTVNAPGFAQAWQSALNDAEEDFSKVLSGNEAFWRKVLPQKNKDDEE